jgi:IgA Peptidase M64/FG-GAP-like repeat
MTNLRPIVTTGNSANRVDVIFLGDGYTAADIATNFTSHIANYLSYIFDDSALTQPFGRYEQFFNIYAVDVISNQSGADDPLAGVLRDTALDASYSWDGVTERLLYVNDTKAVTAMNTALSGTGIGAEMRYVLVNDAKYGGGGYFGVYAAGNPSAREVALHEIGHSFAGLADEYGDPGLYVGLEPSAINVTKSASGAKWAEWLGYNDPVLGTVGAYEGGYYHDFGIYRPTLDSKMRSLDRPFDPIAREEFVHRFYDFVDPLDGYDSNLGTRSNVQSLKVDVIDPEVIHVDWNVNGQVFANAGERFNLANHGFGNGSYTVTARAYDPTDWVRGDRSDLEQTVSWTVANSNVAFLDSAFDFNGDGNSDILWRHAGGAVVTWDMSAAHDLAQHWFGVHDPSWRIRATGDFGGDGNDDLLWRNDGGGVALWQMNGGEIAANSWVGHVDPRWKVAETGDFNGDGKTDIVWRHDGGAAVIWEMDGAVRVRDHWLGVHDPRWRIAEAADFGGDGRDDLLWRHDGGGVAMWQMDGGQKLADNFVDHVAPDWKIADTGDFNGDGKDDLVWRHDGGGLVTWHMDGAEDIAQHWLGVHDPGWKIAHTGDFGGDGKDDLLWRHDGGGVVMWQMDGAQKLADNWVDHVDPGWSIIA